MKCSSAALLSKLQNKNNLFRLGHLRTHSDINAIARYIKIKF